MTENLDDIPQSNDILYALKLSSGEELMCTLIDEDDPTGIVIECPIAVRMIPTMTESGLSNQLASQVWMPFAADRTFFIPKKDIVTLSPLSGAAQAMYVRLVNSLEEQMTPPSEPDTFFIQATEDIH